MKIHEYQAIEIFKNAGIPVAQGNLAQDVDAAIAIANDLTYPVVLKSQVLVGGRGKAGGIKVVKTQEELEATFAQLQKLTIKGYPVERISVVKAIDIKKEFYVAITVDGAKDDIVIISSSEGGVEIEETAKVNPDAIKKLYLDGAKEIDEAQLSEFVGQVFEDASLHDAAKNIYRKLLEVFYGNDCSIAEINPLVIDREGNLLAADAKVNFDDNAMMRHDGLEELRDMRYEDADELEATENNLSFVKLEGNVGCIVNGAGLAMGTMDIIQLSGGKPANFLDVGGSSNPKKVLKALDIILRNKDVKAILINIFGGITRCDDIATGIIQAKNEIDIPVPLVIRLTGTNEKEAVELLEKENMTVFSTMREAVQKVVELSKA